MGFSRSELTEYINEDRKTLEEQEALYGRGESRRLFSMCLDCLERDYDLFSVCFEECWSMTTICKTTAISVLQVRVLLVSEGKYDFW